MRSLLLSLLAVAALLPFGCGLFGPPSDPIDDLRSYVAEEVDDEERSAEMLFQVDRIDDTLRRFASQSRQRVTDLQRALADQTAERVDVQPLIDASNAARDEARRNLIAAALELRSLATQKEWEHIADLEARVFRERYSRNLPVQGDD